MKKLLLLLFASVLLFSCNIEDPTKVDKIELSANRQGDSWTLQDNQTAITITAKVLNSQNATLSQKVEWSSNIPESVKTTTTDNTFSFSLLDINTLGDWEVKAKAGSKESSFSFAISTDKLLANSVVYSLVSSESFITEDDKTTIIEFDATGKRITLEDERMQTSGEIEYYATKGSYLFINTKDNASFGQISAKLNTERQDIVVAEVEGGLLVGGVDWQGADQKITLSVSAGTKQSKDVVINFKEAKSLPLKTPTIGTAVAASSSGAVIDITADSISNSFYKPEGLEGVYTLYVEVLKKNEESGEYEEYNFNNNIETCYIKYGTQVHLTDAGEYKVKARIEGVQGVGEFCEEKSITIEELPLSTWESWVLLEDYDKSTAPLTDGDTYASVWKSQGASKLEEYNKKPFKKLTIKKELFQKIAAANTKQNAVVYIDHIPYNENEEGLECKSNIITIDPYTQTEDYVLDSFKVVGQSEYSVKIQLKNAGSWDGHIYGNLNDFQYKKTWLIEDEPSLEGAFSGGSTSSSIEVDLDKDKIWTTDFLKENATLYYIVLTGDSLAAETRGSYTYQTAPSVFATGNANTKNLQVYYYLYAKQKDSEYSLCSKVYSTSCFSIVVSNPIYVNYNASGKTIYNMGWYHNNTQDAKGTYRPMYYAYSNGYYTPSSWTLYGSTAQISGLSGALGNEGGKYSYDTYVWVKTEPTAWEKEQGNSTPSYVCLNLSSCVSNYSMPSIDKYTTGNLGTIKGEYKGSLSGWTAFYNNGDGYQTYYNARQIKISNKLSSFYNTNSNSLVLPYYYDRYSPASVEYVWDSSSSRPSSGWKEITEEGYAKYSDGKEYATEEKTYLHLRARASANSSYIGYAYETYTVNIPTCPDKMEFYNRCDGGCEKLWISTGSYYENLCVRCKGTENYNSKDSDVYYTIGNGSTGISYRVNFNTKNLIFNENYGGSLDNCIYCGGWHCDCSSFYYVGLAIKKGYYNGDVYATKKDTHSSSNTDIKYPTYLINSNTKKVVYTNIYDMRNLVSQTYDNQ